MLDPGLVGSNPRRISGKHFADLLTCEVRAFFNLYSPKTSWANPPRYLSALMKKGVEFEASIYQSPPFNLTTVIPSHLSLPERERRTLREINSSKDIVLQGCIFESDRIGVVDIIEQKAGKLTVGEIKSSQSLHLSHIMQVKWYAELLARKGFSVHAGGFVILGDSKRYDFDFSTYSEIYESLKSTLFQFRENKDHFVSKLCPSYKIECTSCNFRNFCVPEMIQNNDISLLPQLGKRRIESLRARGVKSLDNLKPELQSNLSFGFSEEKILSIAETLHQYELGLPAFKQKIKLKPLIIATPVVINYNAFILDRKLVLDYFDAFQQQPKNSHFKSRKAMVNQLKNSTLILYGVDYKIVKKILGSDRKRNKIKLIDLEYLIEKCIYFPFIGLELNAIYGQIGKAGSIEPGADRLMILKFLIEWIRKGVENCDSNKL